MPMTLHLPMSSMKCGVTAALAALALVACSRTISGGATPGGQPAPSRPPVQQSATFPWAADAPPPLVAGIRLGDSAAKVRSVLGTPDRERVAIGDLRELDYVPLGLAVWVTGDQGVAMISLMTSDSPELGGVRNGVPLSTLQARWGPPHNRVGQGWIYRTDDWLVMVMADTVQQRVANLSLGWVPPEQRRR